MTLQQIAYNTEYINNVMISRKQDIVTITNKIGVELDKAEWLDNDAFLALVSAYKEIWTVQYHDNEHYYNALVCYLYNDDGNIDRIVSTTFK